MLSPLLKVQKMQDIHLSFLFPSIILLPFLLINQVKRQKLQDKYLVQRAEITVYQFLKIYPFIILLPFLLLNLVKRQKMKYIYLVKREGNKGYPLFDRYLFIIQLPFLLYKLVGKGEYERYLPCKKNRKAIERQTPFEKGKKRIHISEQIHVYHSIAISSVQIV